MINMKVRHGFNKIELVFLLKIAGVYVCHNYFARGEISMPCYILATVTDAYNLSEYCKSLSLITVSDNVGFGA